MQQFVNATEAFFVNFLGASNEAASVPKKFSGFVQRFK